MSGLAMALWRRVAESAMTFEQMFEMARDIWRRNGSNDPLIIWPHLVTSEIDKQHLLNVAAKQYGQRPKRKGT